MQLSEYTRAINLDLSCPIKDLIEKHGVSETFFQDVVTYLPEVEILPGIKITFEVVVEVDSLPPEIMHAGYFDGKDSEKTYKRILKGLTEILGVPEDVSASNTISHQWEDERIELSITVFPRRLDFDLMGGSGYFEKYPEKAYEVRFSIFQKSTFHYLKDSEKQSLLSNALLLDNPLEFVLHQKKSPTGYERNYFYKNESKNTNYQIFTGACIGYIGEEFSLKVKKSDIKGIKLVRFIPGRFGYSIILLKLYSSEFDLVIFEHNEVHGCDYLADTLATFWKLDLQIAENAVC